VDFFVLGFCFGFSSRGFIVIVIRFIQRNRTNHRFGLLFTSGRPGENPHNYQDSIRVEEPPQQKQKAPQTTINKNPTMKKTTTKTPTRKTPTKNSV
jgi:hypothetical protein